MGRAEAAAGYRPGAEEEMAALRAEHGGAGWVIVCDGDRWHAGRRDGTGSRLSRASAPGLSMALRLSRGSK
jgi:hypothetical protein